MGPRYTETFKANLTGADIFTISTKCRYIQHIWIYFGGIPHAFFLIFFGGSFNVGIIMSNEDKVQPCWLRSANIYYLRYPQIYLDNLKIVRTYSKRTVIFLGKDSKRTQEFHKRSTLYSNFFIRVHFKIIYLINNLILIPRWYAILRILFAIYFRLFYLRHLLMEFPKKGGE